jgi:drug/metabolite transporter (DMT)-like permease
VKALDIFELGLLGTLWGGSFLFMRVAVPEFGAIPLITMRVAIASLFLLPFLIRSRSVHILRERAGSLMVLALLNSALPFCLFAFATLTLTAGFTAVINAVAPLFTALVALIWLRETLGRVAVLGLLLGLVGVVLLVWDKLEFTGNAVSMGIAAAMLASLSYGVAANFIKVKLGGIGSVQLAAGSQIMSTLFLLPLCVWLWPAQMPSLQSWLAVLVLGVFCTGIAYILFFRLMGRLGPTRAITVTFLVPLTAMLFGALFLGERVSAQMLVGCGLILLGTAQATGLVKGAKV